MLSIHCTIEYILVFTLVNAKVNLKNNDINFFKAHEYDMIAYQHYAIGQMSGIGK